MTQRVERHDDAFAFLIAPISTADFFTHIFERDVLVVSRHDATYATELYDVGCVEDALVVGAAEPDHFALVKDDVFSSIEMTSERRTIRARSARRSPRALIDPRSVLAAFADGYTLNIKDASAFHPPLARLCNRIQSQHGFYVNTNAYFTPPGAAGFGLHYDTHDTLIVQIDGSKDWEIHDPVVPLPLEMQPFSRAAHAGKTDEPRRIRLETGDSLYIPHGFPHRAFSSSERSLHLTFALAPIREIDLLEALIGLAALENLELRRALPPGWRQDPDFAARYAARIAGAVERAISPERVALAADLAQNELFAATRTVAAGTFDALAACERMTPRSRIALRAETPYERRMRDDRVNLILASKVVSLPGNAEPALARLERGPATLAEIVCLLQPAAARDFVRTLVIEGLAELSDAAAPRSRVRFDTAPEADDRIRGTPSAATSP